MIFNTVNYDPSDPQIYAASLLEPTDNLDRMLTTLEDEMVSNDTPHTITRIDHVITHGLGLVLTATTTTLGGQKVRTVESIAHTPADVSDFLTHVTQN